MKALILAEHPEDAYGLCAGARGQADTVIAVAIGNLEIPGGVADTVAHIALPEGAVFDDAADTVIALFDNEQPDVVYVEPSRRMKSIAGKLASHIGSSVITDVLSFDEDGATSLYFGGVGERIRQPLGVALYSLKPEAFASQSPSGQNTVVEVDWVAPQHPLKLVSTSKIEKSGVDLTKADRVVGAGRGFAEKDDLDLARSLCEKIDAGLGCTRPLTEGVDWLPTEVYIGVSGLMLTPQVYIAIGISGQMQHMVGCNRAATVFAINKDSNAPVFKQCDYGLVGDIKKVLPQLIEAL